MKIAIMAGGTGGHIFPGLAVADELKNKGIDVVWLGAIGGMEEELVKRQNIVIKLLPIKGLRGKGIKGLITLPFILLRASKQAANFFNQEKVNAVISMGGYVAGPGGLAAKFKGIPLLVHEQNSKFGMTNKYLSKWAKKVLTGFNLNGLYKSQWVGNPVRKDIETCKKITNLSENVNVLIIGGSLGANSLNTIIPKILSDESQKTPLSIIHQCGKNNSNKTIEQYKDTINSDIQVHEFIDDMSQAYAWADFVIARAGALTIAEINAVGLPAIFIPYPHAVDDHQTSNANNIVQHYAGYIWQESQNEIELKELVFEMISNKNLRETMAVNSKQLHQNDSALKVAEICLEIAA